MWHELALGMNRKGKFGIGIGAGLGEGKFI